MANIVTDVPVLKLNDGHGIPMLGYGFGTSQKQRSADDAVATAKSAIAMGFTHLDGAEDYKNEAQLGTAIKQSKVQRDKLFVTTKLSPNSVGDVEGALKTSLKALGLDYVDLYLIHHPFFAASEADIQTVWAAMEVVQRAGLTRSIGVSNFSAANLTALLATASTVPAVNQIEFHAYLQQPQLLKLHKQRGIATAAYASLTPLTRAAPGPADEFLDALAKKYAVSPGEIALRWCIDQDIVAITTSTNEQRLSDYLRATTFKLTPAEIKQLCELGEQKSFRGFYADKFNDQ